MYNISMDSEISKNSDIYSSEIDDEVIMMNIDNNSYYTITEIGNRIWVLMDSLNTPQAICQQLMEEFEVSTEQCQKEVLQFLNQLLENNVVILK